MSEVNLMRASHEWATRPDDQRYLSLQDLKAAVDRRRNQSWTLTEHPANLRVTAGNDGASLTVGFVDHEKVVPLAPTNWAFGQLASVAGAPAQYLRKLPGPLAAVNLQWNLEHGPEKNISVLGHGTEGMELRAVTSPTYGRIWDSQVVEAVQRAAGDGRWVIPAASYATTDPKRATTLYASDRDVFIFLVDPKNPVEVNGEQLFRGFYVWNSEVGKCTFGLTTFLYRYVCDNRIIWGASQVRELRIRHTSGAPERFAREGRSHLTRYADESTTRLAEGIRRAQATPIPLNEGKGETVAEWLRARGFTKAQADSAVTTAATTEQGKARSFWDIVNGITAYARTVPHTDDRVDLEAKAGKLMEMVTE